MFPGHKADRSLVEIKPVWHAMRHAAGMDTLRLHDCRHAFASVGADMGIPLLTLGTILGHREHHTTKKYAHLGESPTARATDEISGAIAAHLSGSDVHVRALNRTKMREKGR